MTAFNHNGKKRLSITKLSFIDSILYIFPSVVSIPATACRHWTVGDRAFKAKIGFFFLCQLPNTLSTLDILVSVVICFVDSCSFMAIILYKVYLCSLGFLCGPTRSICKSCSCNIRIFTVFPSEILSRYLHCPRLSFVPSDSGVPCLLLKSI